MNIFISILKINVQLHSVSNRKFIIWIYFNDEDEFYPEQELKIILQLALEHRLDENGWDNNITLTKYRAF